MWRGKCDSGRVTVSAPRPEALAAETWTKPKALDHAQTGEHQQGGWQPREVGVVACSVAAFRCRVTVAREAELFDEVFEWAELAAPEAEDWTAERDVETVGPDTGFGLCPAGVPVVAVCDCSDWREETCVDDRRSARAAIDRSPRTPAVADPSLSKTCSLVAEAPLASAAGAAWGWLTGGWRFRSGRWGLVSSGRLRNRLGNVAGSGNLIGGRALPGPPNYVKRLLGERRLLPLGTRRCGPLGGRATALDWGEVRYALRTAAALVARGALNA
jgi:hypothetical protein